MQDRFDRMARPETRRLETREKKKREYHQHPRVVDPGVPCPVCECRYQHRITHVYGDGKRRRICANCGTPFVSVEIR